MSQIILLCERIDAGIAQATHQQISAHLAQFLSRFPRPLPEVEKSIGAGVKKQAMTLLDHVLHQRCFGSQKPGNETTVPFGTKVGLSSN